ncbi:MAG: DUF5050 domain-containing protein [Firmicutes bacterium]|nr:DUF5050 domain-containing protein [Bacillota bacterium]
MNTSNGALIIRHKKLLYVCDLENHLGTHVLNEDSQLIGKINGLMWFAASWGEDIYYSNQKDHDYLYCLDTQSLSENCILNWPCSYLTVYADSLYFLHEADNFIYKLELPSHEPTAVIKEEFRSFIIHEGFLYGAQAQGLLKFDMHSTKSSLLTGHMPFCLNLLADVLYYADCAQDYYLCSLCMDEKKPHRVDLIKTQSIISEGNYLYAANMLDNRAIVRINAVNGETIRFCGEKAEKLHIIDNYLYFLNQHDKNAWYKMPLSGGRCLRVMKTVP